LWQAIELSLRPSMDFRSKQIAPPREWAIFEDICLALFRAEWNDPLALKNGRIGQPQHGVDVYGSPRSERDKFYGVQCKGKNRNYGARATVDELKAELAKAEKFEPKLARWIFATSASKDGKLQRASRLLSAERESKGQFPVTALGWEDIQSLLARHPNVVEDFYPEHAYDIAGLLKALRQIPTSDEVCELRDHIRRLNEARSNKPGTWEHSQWDLVSFSGERDLGPALLGRALGPADASACPRLQEADIVVAHLRRAFAVRLVGGPGSGKSVCAYQAANDFAEAGWKIRRLRDASVADDLTELPQDELSLFLIDDAHLMSRPALQRIEEAAGPRRLVLSIHNGVEDGQFNRGAIVIDAKRAVKTIAAELLLRPEQTLAAVRRTDDDVGIDFLNTPLERRIDDAVYHSDRPWQFCFVLGGGWKRAKEAADAARAAKADLILAAAGILQLASRDAPLNRMQLQYFCEQNGVALEGASSAVSWLVSQRLLISDSDCRCPHQRFALVVLARILEGQDNKGRTTIGGMLSNVVCNADFPISGLRLLLHELKFLGDYRRWTALVKPEALEPLIVRCWGATSAEDRHFAALLFSDLNTYVEGWYERIHKHHILTIADWITNAAPPMAYGLRYLLNALRNDRDSRAAEIVTAVNPDAIAHITSAVTHETADHCAELIETIGWKPPDSWKSKFNRTFNRSATLALARTWPSSARLYDIAHFCNAISIWDEEIALEMVDAFTPMAQKALAHDPVSAFEKLDDIFGRLLRISDPLGVYVGKRAPDRRRLALGKGICKTLKPKLLAAQLSATARRDFQSATFLLGFLKKASKSKFKATVEAIDWSRIARTIGDQWANLSHQTEIFLTVSYSSDPARVSVTNIVEENIERIEKFSPRLAIMMPEVAIRHIERGKHIRLSQHGHFEFEFTAILVVQLQQLRPNLIETMLAPFELVASDALSRQNSSWFRHAPMFVEALRDVAPASLQRILTAVDTNKAEEGWADSLLKKGPAQDAVALLIESALSREDAVGDMARRLRKKFRNKSAPKKRKLQRGRH
jgi:hypothetical protein